MIEGLLDTLAELDPHRDVRLLVTGRSHEGMMRRFARLQSLPFENMMAEELAADIALHVEQELRSQNRPRWVNQEIMRKVEQKSGGAGKTFFH